MGLLNDFQDITFEIEGGIGRVALNRPEKMNAFRLQTLLELKRACDEMKAPSVGVATIEGKGEKAFCVGGDIEEMSRFTEEEGQAFIEAFQDLHFAIRNLEKPVIAKIHGYCMGGGNELNLMCDLTLAAESAIFAQSGPAIGMAPINAGCQMLPRLVGDKKAKELIFTGRKVSAKEAADLGWINRAVPGDRLDEEVRALCEEILSMSPQAIKLCKQTINYESDQLAPSFNRSPAALSKVYGSEEAKEGLRAFLEKRKPDFKRFRSYYLERK